MSRFAAVRLTARIGQRSAAALFTATALLACLLVSFVVVPGAEAERLPVKAYGLAQGLPSTFVNHIVADSRGLLWFSTRDGLARFDGSRFVTYGIEDGLPIPDVNFLLETRQGGYWVATNGGGVCRMDAAAVGFPPPAQRPASPFQCLSLGVNEPADRVNVLAEDRDGRVWIGTDRGLFRIDDLANGRDRPVSVDLRDVWGDGRPVGVSALLAGEAGEMWIGTGRGVLRLLDGAPPLLYPLRPAAPEPPVRDIARGADGHIWVAYPRGLLRICAAPPSSRLVRPGAADATSPSRETSHWIGLSEGEGEIGESALVVSADGRARVGTDKGLLEFDGRRFRRYGATQGLPERLISELAEDRNGDLWIASLSGVTKLSADGFLTYDEHDGLTADRIHALFEDATGQVFAVGGNWIISRFDGMGFVSVQPRVPPVTPRWMAQLAFLDRRNAWWILGDTVLGRYPAVERIEEIDGRLPPRVYPDRQAIGPTFERLFEDSRGDVWWAARGETDRLGRWDRKTERFERYPDVGGRVAVDRPLAFGEDTTGAVWLGFSNGLIRYDGSRFRRLSGSDVPGGAITAIHRDRNGRLWIGSNRDGLARVDEPGAERPRFVRYTRQDGLSSNNVRCITSDASGRIYVGTVRGVDRLDPRTGTVRRYTTDDGLANGFVTAALHDSRGRLWFGTLDGLSRLVGAGERPVAAPSTWIEAWRVNGVAQPVSHLGQARISDVVLEPGQHQIDIEFYGVGFREAGGLRYQYRLEEADRDWSRPSVERIVRYSHLAPGRYRFQVRAVTSDGVAGVTPAAMEFVILPPVWQRWWFRVAVVLGMMLIAFVAHRYEVARLLQTERVRTRIASDLHDDIGSSLSQIAILSEVARTSAGDDPRIAAPLGRIATLSRESVDAMGDIVWAIDPHRDTATHLTQRMRRLASDVLEARGIEVRFDTADASHPRLGADVRREVLLIFKEALHNVTRHANAANVAIALTITNRRLHLVVEDNGRGFDATSVPDGQGLRSMARRAERLGGRLEVASSAGTGARVALTVPL
jgi:signal transduction histidine kinase/ligand-binding sensor domain-containing protein